MDQSKCIQVVRAPQIKVRTNLSAGAGSEKGSCAQTEKYWQNQYQHWLAEAKRRGCA